MLFTKTLLLQRIAAITGAIILPIAILSVVAAQTPDDKPAASTQPQVQLKGQSTLLAENSQATGNKTQPVTKPAATKASPTPSQNVTINLINRLVQRGVLLQSDADELIKQAEQDAVIARQQAVAAVKAEAARAPSDENLPSLFPPDLPVPTNAPQTMSTSQTASAPSGPPSVIPPAEGGDDEVRVQYVPEVVKEQIASEIRQQVLQQARDENWAAPRTFPDWISRFKPFADIRVRYEGFFYADGNDATGAFPNFNAINTGSPYDVSKISNPSFPPELNANRDRTRFRLRLRLGAEMDLDDGFTFGVRFASGESNSPTSPNQSLGVANNSQGGNFSKYAIWIDRAFIRYEIGGTPSRDLAINAGRFDNPFFTASELIWDEDLGFDGLAISARYQVHDGVTPFLVAGGFPIFNTDLNFSTTRPNKYPSDDKYLLGGQLGTSLRFNEDFSAKIAGAFYDFENVQGRLSSPFTPLTSSDQGNTDDTRPSFAQNGNTYFPLRDIVPTSDNGFGTTKLYQYYGLASKFQVVNFTGTVDYAHFDPFHLKFYGEYLQNVAFDSNAINAVAVNNRGPNLATGAQGNFVGGNTGWIVGLKAGTPAFEKRWDWSVGINYRYIESDATVDGFADSDFGANFAGTNLKGYTIFGSLALTPHTSLFLRWMSADSVAGPPLHDDVLQFDFSAKF